MLIRIQGDKNVEVNIIGFCHAFKCKPFLWLRVSAADSSFCPQLGRAHVLVRVRVIH